MSSRNIYLSREDRRAALAISRALRRGEDMLKGGESDARKIREAALMTLTAEPRVLIDYVSVSDELTFEELETIDRMCERGVRRVPVVNDAGALVGILAVDDVIELAAEQLSGLARLVRRERTREEQRRP